MSQFPHHVSCKINPLCRLFSKLVSFDHHHQGGNEIEDDWEYIEALDREFESEQDKENGEDIEMGEREPNLLAFSSLDQPNYVKMKYTVLSRTEVRRRLEDKITKVCTVFSLSRSDAAILLQLFEWSVSRTNEEWLTCEEKIRNAVGLFVRPVAETLADATEIACLICHGGFPRDFMYSVSCGHQFCRACWEGYIKEAINEGPRILTLRCPAPSCDAAVGLYFIELLLSQEDDKTQIEDHLLRTYIAHRRKAKWCPAPDCNYIVFSSNGGEGNVTCRCSHCFCWRCSREGHTPVDCGTLIEWMSERDRQSGNWMLAYTVSCPKCKFKFDQSSCNSLYVICNLCIFKFCRTCGDRMFNNESQGHWSHKCNPIAESLIESAEYSFERYNLYYKEWVTCESSREHVIAELKMFQDLQLELLCAMFNFSSTHLNFLVEALQQIAEGWQLLKWMHVYGYYLADDNLTKKHLFEFMQEEARSLVQRLHTHVEQLQDFLYVEASFDQFMKFRNKITVLTRVLRNYTNRLIEGLKGGLSEVVCNPELRPKLQMWSERGESSCCKKTSNRSPSSSPTSEVMHESGTNTGSLTVYGSTNQFLVNIGTYALSKSESELESNCDSQNMLTDSDRQNI